MLASIVGILIVVPPFFLEDRLGRDYPPPINHPEYFYGFFTAVLAWQLMYMLIGTDPIRFRPAMLVAIFAKSSYAAAILILYAKDRVIPTSVAFAAMDAAWAVLFATAYVRTPNAVPFAHVDFD